MVEIDWRFARARLRDRLGGRAMAPDRARRVYEIFQAVLASEPAGRAARLDVLCGGDVELRAEVERLLARDAEAEGAGFLPLPGQGEPEAPQPFPLAPQGLGVHIRCPHCHNPIELVTLPDSGEVHCTLCGSTFQLEVGSTMTWSGAARGRKLGRFELIEAVGSGAFGTVYK